MWQLIFLTAASEMIVYAGKRLSSISLTTGQTIFFTGLWIING